MYDILFHGWYFKQNVGDDLFVKSFDRLFKKSNTFFTENRKDLIQKKYKHLIIGGGNIIHEDLNEFLKEVKTDYEFWSVSVLDKNQALIAKNAKRIIVRDKESFSIVKESGYSGDLRYIPDVVFLNEDTINKSKKNKEMAIMTNANYCPNYKSTISKNQEYERFISETARFIDELKQKVFLVPMQTARKLHDNFMSNSIIMSSVEKNIFTDHANLCDLVNFPNYKMIFSMRYHGLILGMMANIPIVCIDGHSKMKFFAEEYGIPRINYYEYSKDCMKRAYEQCVNEPQDFSQTLKEISMQIEEYNELSKQIIEQTTF